MYERTWKRERRKKVKVRERKKTSFEMVTSDAT